MTPSETRRGLKHWILRIDPEFDEWMDGLPTPELDNVQTVLRAIECSSAMPWDYFERGISVTQNIDDIEALHELHLSVGRGLLIVFTVVRRNILFVDYGTLREMRRRSILKQSSKRLPALLDALNIVMREESGYV